MFYVIRFILSWSIWLLIADKKRWREIVPVCLLATFLGSLTDTIMTYHTLWKYLPDRMFPAISDDLAIYFVTAYLFIQFLPKRKGKFPLFGYFVLWTSISFLIEWYHTATHRIVYYNGWNLGWSYLADWILFYLFYRFYKVFYVKRPDSALEKSLEHIDDILFILDREGRVISDHGKWLRNNRVEQGRYCGKGIEEYIGPGNDFTIHYDVLKKVLKGESVRYEWEWLHPLSKRVHHMQSSVSPLRNEEGEIVGVIGIGREQPSNNNNQPIQSSYRN